MLQALRIEGSDPQGHRLGPVGGGDLAAEVRRRTSSSALSGAVLQPGDGFRDLFANATRDKRYYSVLLNAILTY